MQTYGLSMIAQEKIATFKIEAAQRKLAQEAQKDQVRHPSGAQRLLALTILYQVKVLQGIADLAHSRAAHLN